MKKHFRIEDIVKNITLPSGSNFEEYSRLNWLYQITVELIFHNFHVYLAEDHVLAIEEGRRHGADEELCVCLFKHSLVCLCDIYIHMCVDVYICMFVYTSYICMYKYTYWSQKLVWCEAIVAANARQDFRCVQWEVGGWGRDPFSRNFMKPTPRRKWYLTTGRRFH